MNQPISIIVPSYRREDALCKMLSTLLEQDINNFEILLIDQTREHTPETKQFLASNAKRIKQVFQETANLPMARNNGLSLACGEYIIFIDDDVLLPSNCIRRLIKHLSVGAAVGVTGLINFDKSDKELRQEYGISLNHASHDLIFVNQFIGAVMAFRHEVFDKIGGFDERLGVLSSSASGEDTEFCRRARRAGLSLAIDPTLVIQHPLGTIGGCAARELAPEVARERHIQSGFYIEMKLAERQGRIGIQGWARMLRSWAINRGLFEQGIPASVRNVISLRKHFSIVQNFYNQGSC